MSAPTTTNDGLDDFLSSAKNHGIPDESIVMLLRQNGWPERRISRAFSAYYASVLGVPLPIRTGRSEHARDAFYYLLNFIMLGFWTIALGQLFYVLIDRWLPDPVTHLYQSSRSLMDEIAWQIATLIVTFPAFLFVHRLIGEQLRSRPDLYESGVRKWLTYIALVIAALVVLCDGIWLLQTFLRGEITALFILHSLLLFIIGGGVFSYYLVTINPPRSDR
jgi:Domain of unknown function (DUF5671)